MALLEQNNIASWCDVGAAGMAWECHQDIATESSDAPNPAWLNCIDSVLKVLTDASMYSHGDIDPPSSTAIKAALCWLSYLQKKSPTAPPSLIAANPNGGITIEWRGDNSVVWELSLGNDETAESTLYHDGRIISMADMPFRPTRH